MFWQQRPVQKSEGAEHHCASSKMAEFPNYCQIKLMSHIKQVDIRKVYSVEEEFSDYIQADEVVHGCFRDLGDFLPRLAKFYLQTRQKSNEALKRLSL